MGSGTKTENNKIILRARSSTIITQSRHVNSHQMKINPHIFRAYDIRGIADNGTDHSRQSAAAGRADQAADLTAETAYLIGRGVASYLIREYGVRNMAVGRDNRLSGPALEKAYVRGLTESGLDVTLLGLSVSPMIYWSSCALDFDAATNITASHNPKEYNGFKVVTKGAHSICGEELQKILTIIEKDDFTSTEKHGKTLPHDIKEDYLSDLKSRIPESKPLHIVIDAGNGIAGPFAPQFLRSLGHEVTELYCEPDGNFPNHEANPEELANMRDLIAAVKKENADLGMGFDGDGDRLGIVDEQGHLYSADYLLLLLTEDLVSRVKNPQIVFDIKVSQAIINQIEKFGATPVMSKTGHSFIEKKMKEIGAPLAGEVSGHLFFAENYYGFDDALLAAGKIAAIVAQSGKPFSQLFENLPRTYTTPEFKAHCPDDKKFEIVKKLVEHFTAIYDCITIDGVRINFDETSWGAVRASNTSPNLTLRFEAETPERLAEIQQIMVTELEKYPAVSLGWYKADE